MRGVFPVWSGLPAVAETQTEGRGFVVVAEGVVGPAVGGQLFGKAVTAAEFNPAQRLVIDCVNLSQTGNPNFVTVSKEIGRASCRERV